MTDTILIEWADVPAPLADNGSEQLIVAGVDYTAEMNKLGYYLVRDMNAIVNGVAYDIDAEDVASITRFETQAERADAADAWLASQDAAQDCGFDEQLSGDAYDAYWATVQRIRQGDYRTEAQVAADADRVAVDVDEEFNLRPTSNPLIRLLDRCALYLSELFPEPQFVSLDYVPPSPIQLADDVLADAGFEFAERAVILNALADGCPGIFDEPAEQ